MEQFIRTELLFGSDNMKKLAEARVAVFGVGGVGGHVVEALARSGVGTLDLIDADVFSISNINRQMYATLSTIGQNKVDVAAAHLKDINPDIVVNTYPVFYLPQNQDSFDFKLYDYVVDAIDTVTGKIALVMQAKEAKTPIISSMGAGNKVNPAMFEVADIYETSVCPLAKVMRKELAKRGVDSLKVVYSKEKALTPLKIDDKAEIDEADEGEAVIRKRNVPGSNAFVPSVAGLIIASEVIKDITGFRND